MFPTHSANLLSETTKIDRIEFVSKTLQTSRYVIQLNAEMFLLPFVTQDNAV